MVKEGTFREDLFYRLNVIHLILPPLRDRREDISLLANHFLQKFSSENQRDIIDIDPMAMSLLTAWSWPGNRTRTALMLGISRRALMYKLQEYGIDPADV